MFEHELEHANRRFRRYICSALAHVHGCLRVHRLTYFWIQPYNTGPPITTRIALVLSHLSKPCMHMLRMAPKKSEGMAFLCLAAWNTPQLKRIRILHLNFTLPRPPHLTTTGHSNANRNAKILARKESQLAA